MRLFLMRHTKAATQEGQPDHDRPLTERGVRDARTMGHWLQAHEVAPNVVWCSSALRARQTWSAAAAVLTDPPAPSYLRSVYQAGPGDLIDLLADVPADTESLLIVGHNPTMQQVVAQLTGETRDIPTGGVAVIEVAGSWADPGRCRLLDFASPQHR